MSSAAATRENPSFSSSRVQRAARLNNVETTKLLQQIQYLEKAKQHQCRLTNQDIRMVSMSIDYIQAHSGNSQEAWRPPSRSSTDIPDDDKQEGPCFMYGERIISRKIRRMTRPMSAMDRLDGRFSQGDSDLSTSGWDDLPEATARPKSSCGIMNVNKNRPFSAMSWLKWNDSNWDGREGAESTMDTPRSAHTNRPFSAVSTVSSVKEPWEDDTSAITKKILKSQARSQMGKRNSVYQSANDVMSAQSSKKVRDLARKIRITTTQISHSDIDPSATRGPHTDVLVTDKPPKRPNHSKDFLGRRATFTEILNQHKPTLSAGSWKQHLGHNSNAGPVSFMAQHKARLEAKKELNNSRRADVTEKVKEFMVKRNS